VHEACNRVLEKLLVKVSSRAARFDTLSLGYLLKVPETSFGDGLPLRPRDLMQPLRTLAAAERGDGSTLEEAPESDVDITGYVTVPPPAEAAETAAFDEERAMVVEELAQAMRRGRELKAEATGLNLELQRAQAAAKATAGPHGRERALRVMAEDLTQVVRKVNKLHGKDGFAIGGAGQAEYEEHAGGRQDSPKRRFYSSEEENAWTGHLASPKRHKGLLG